jgi:hypothetical protein
MSIPADLAPLSALDLQGQPVLLGSLWATRPVLLVYIRHYG